MAETAPPRTVFADVDNLPPPMVALLLGALERMDAHPEIRRVREVALHALGPAPGERLLDAGCGVGWAARHLAARMAPAGPVDAAGVSPAVSVPVSPVDAARVSPAVSVPVSPVDAAGVSPADPVPVSPVDAGLVVPRGEVVALDRSSFTVAAARERHDGSPVRYVTGDITALDFPDGTFDGVRSERVLQHLADPGAAIAELIRVTRPRGRVCLVDTDWDSVAIDGLPEHLVAAVRGHLFRRVMVHHRDMGRTLRRRLIEAGLTGVTAVPVALCLEGLASAATIFPAVDREVPREAQMIPDELHEQWFAELDSADRRGVLLATLTIWVATGTKP